MSTPIFSNRVVPYNHRRGNRSKQDEELVKHTQGILYPFHTQMWSPTFLEQRATRKIRSFNRFTFTTAVTGSGDGWGFVYTTPTAASDPSLSQHAVNTPTLPSNNFANAVATGVFTSPYTRAEFTSSTAKSRCISCAMRVRNISTMLNRGGTLHALKSVDDGNIPGVSFDNIIAEYDISGNSWRCDTSGRKWSYLAWTGRETDQMEFSNTASPPVGNNSGIEMARTLAFVAFAPGSIAQTYEVEIVNYFEVLGGGTENQVIQGATKGDGHHLTQKVHQVVSELHLRPSIMENEGNSVLAGFITDCVKAGHGVQDIVNAATDVAGKVATILPQALAATRALGSFL